MSLTNYLVCEYNISPDDVIFVHALNVVLAFTDIDLSTKSSLIATLVSHCYRDDHARGMRALRAMTDVLGRSGAPIPDELKEMLQ